VKIRHAFRAGAALAGLALVAATAAPAGAATTPTITITLSPTTIDYFHHTITVSGAVSTVPTGTEVTLACQDAEGQGGQVVAMTAADGSYGARITNPFLGGSGSVTATVSATATTSSASVSADYNLIADLLTVKGGFAQSRERSGASDVLTGVADVSSGSISEPLPDALLEIYTDGNAYSGITTGYVETASDGSFRYVAPGSRGGSLSYTVESAVVLLDGGATFSFGINELAQVTSFAGTLSADHRLQFDACGGTEPALPDGPLIGRLDYQYAARPAGPWKTIGAGSEIQYATCFTAGFGANYPGQFRAPLAAGYYRAYAPAVTGQMSAVSKVIYLWRYPAKFTGFSVKSGRDGTVTISGRLWRLDGTWIADARQQISIEYRHGHKTYRPRPELTTNSAGRFSITVRVAGAMSWQSVYSGDHNQFAVATKRV
jgi:hypothetical protein